MKLEKSMQDFLEKHIDRKKSYLLAYSGGPDSKALLHLLLKNKISIHVAHVDHGWRKTSSFEADEIEREILSLGLVFYCTRLTRVPTRDAENEARKSRLAFFQKIVSENSLEGVFLAHHKDDLAETTLQRIFEGSHVLYGMKSIQSISSLTLFRPLLQTRKKEILDFLESKSLSFIQDETNFDPKYLRSRIRGRILPFLQEVFGKRISENLAILSKRSLELEHYLDERIQPFLKTVIEGPWGSGIFVPKIPRVELRHLVQKLGKERDVAFSRKSLEKFLDWIEEGKSNVEAPLSKKVLLYQGWVFFLKSYQPEFPVIDQLVDGCYHSRNVTIIIDRKKRDPAPVSWQGIFQGKVCLSVSHKHLSLENCTDTSMKKRLSQQKIPPFLRFLPSFCKNGQFYRDLFSKNEIEGIISVTIIFN